MSPDNDIATDIDPIFYPDELLTNGALYQELKACAGRILSQHGNNITIQTTEVVHEACVKLMEARLSFQSKAHLFRTAAKTMRHLLIDYIRAKSANKRGGSVAKTQWLDELLGEQDATENILAFEQCINQICALGKRTEAIIELHYFAGLSQQKVADTLEISLRTVERELTFARSFLYDRLLSANN